MKGMYCRRIKYRNKKNKFYPIYWFGKYPNRKKFITLKMENAKPFALCDFELADKEN